VFSKSFSSGKYKTYAQVALEKGKRLLIPFFAVGIFCSFPLKLVSGYYNNSTSILKDFIVGQLLVQGNTYL
jgi:hypothetical protein